MFGALLKVEMLQKCTPLWHEAHLQVKMYKTLQLLLVVEMFKKCKPLWHKAHFQPKSARHCGAKHVSKWTVLKKHKVGQRTQKQDGTQHASFWKSCGVGSCALHEIDVRSLLKHRAHWWYQGPQFTKACCVSYVYILLVAASANVISSIPPF